MIIKIKSDNPNFLDLIKKNPNSFDGIQLRTHKNGVGIGRIISPSEYHIVFQDTKHSYSGDTSNQIDFQSFCNPRAFLGMTSLFLKEMLDSRYHSKTIPWLENKSNAEVDSSGYSHSVVVENIYSDIISTNREFVFEKYFEEISVENIGGKNNRLIVSSNGRSLFETINLAVLSCVYIASTNRQPWFINADVAEKYVKILENVRTVPYFILYIFSRVCLPSEDLFAKFASRLESLYQKSHAGSRLSMKYGNTQMMRVNHNSDMLMEPVMKSDGSHSHKITTNIVEIGCGEGEYPFRLARRLSSGLSWWSVDLEDYSFLSKKMEDKVAKGAEFFFTQEIDSIPIKDNTVVLMVEVIEHMPLGDARALIRETMSKHLPSRMIVTTPDRDFNCHYRFNDEDNSFRHSDHHFEMTSSEFESFMNSFLNDFPEYTGRMFNIGDEIDGVSTSIGYELIRS